MPYLPYTIHPPLIRSQQQNHRGISLLRRKLMDSYTAYKYIAMAFNMLFILRTIDDLHESGIEAVNVVHHGKTISASMVEAIFQLFMYVIVLLCLIMDMIIINTKKLSIANSFWKPGILFFVMTFGDQSIRLLNNSMNSHSFYDSCRMEMGPFNPLVATICDLKMQMNNMTGIAVFCRDMIASCIYVFSVYSYVGYLVGELKQQYQDTLSMDHMRAHQPNGTNNGIDPVVIHPRSTNEGFRADYP
ncbi:hypothetical protein BC941DRAFT_476568 [Chlamydoabsidia padenii]|nr:hypothetical protein BC941DRAFT_476568 [Chlamydoabsidia padenii]